jgi:hypothetical protein
VGRTVNRMPYAKTILMPTGSSSRNHINTANSTAITLTQNLLLFIVPLSIILCLMHLAKTKSRVTDSHPVESATRLSLLRVERRTRGFASPPLGGFAFSLAISMVVKHFPKTKSRVTDSQPVESVTRLSLLLAERRTRGFASPPLDGFAFSLVFSIAATTPCYT